MHRYFYIEDNGDIYEIDGADGSTTFLYSGPTRFADAYNNEITTNFGSFDGKLAYVTANTSAGAVEFAIVDVDSASHTTEVFDVPWSPYVGDRFWTAWTADGICVLATDNRLDGLDLASGESLWSRPSTRSTTVRLVGDRADGVYPRRLDGFGTRRIDPADGTDIWAHTSTARQDGIAADGEGTYVRYNDFVIQLDRETGDQTWITEVGENRRYAAGGGRLMTAYGSAGDVIDTENGSIVWTATHGLFVGTPRRVFADEHLLFTVGAWGEMAAYDRDTATRLWSTNANARNLIALVEAPAGPTEADSTVAGSSSIPATTAHGSMDATAKSDVSVDGGAYLQHVEAFGAIDTVLTADSSVEGVSSIQQVEAFGEITAPHPEGGTDESPDVQLLVTGQFFGSTWDDGSLYRTDLATGLMEPLIDLSYGPWSDRYKILGHPRAMPDEPLYLERDGRVHMLHPASMQISAPVWQIPDGMKLIVLAGGDVIAYSSDPETRIYRRYDITTGEMLWETGPIEEEVVSIEPDYFPNLDRLFLRVKESPFSQGNPEKNRYDEINLSTGERSFLVDWPDNFFVRAADTFGLYGTFNINQPGGEPTEFYVAKVAFDGGFIWQTRRDDRTNLLSMAVSDDRVFALIQDASGGGISFHTVAAYADNTGTELWRSDYTGRSWSTGSFYRDGQLLSAHKLLSPSAGDTLATLTGAGWENTGLKERGFYMVRGEGFNAAPLDATPYVLEGVSSDIKGERVAAGVAALSDGADTTVANTSGQWSIDRGEGTGESIVIAFSRSGGQWKVSRPVLRRPAT